MTPSQQDKLRSLWKPTIYDVIYDPKRDEVNIVAGIYRDVPKIKFLPLLSIGQCIELLTDRTPEFLGYFNRLSIDFSWEEGELIDALWNEVKHIL